MNVLILYDPTQTYTNTVYEHLVAFQKYSANQYFFCGLSRGQVLSIDTSAFDALCIHYSIRLPHDGLAEGSADLISMFQGLKFAFLQDEYEFTNRAIYWINRLALDLVFTVVPSTNIDKIYPPSKLTKTEFVNNLTGYVPEHLPVDFEWLPPSSRRVVVGYRGRTLPLRFGALGFEKYSIGELVKSYCEANSLPHDIAWDEGSRIYGDAWYRFVASSKCTLGTESGSNIFDWDGDLDERISDFRERNEDASDLEAYQEVLADLEVPGLMNQVSPKVFEAIYLRTALVLFEGEYSSILIPWRHFIPLKKDGSNLQEVFSFLADDSKLDEMVDLAYEELIESGIFSYRSFIRLVDEEIAKRVSSREGKKDYANPLAVVNGGTILTTSPIRAKSSMAPRVITVTVPEVLMKLGRRLPSSLRNAVQRLLRVLEDRR